MTPYLTAPVRSHGAALVESTAQFQCQPSWLSWVTGLMLRVEAIQRQERFGSRGHALSLPS